MKSSWLEHTTPHRQTLHTTNTNTNTKNKNQRVLFCAILRRVLLSVPSFLASRLDIQKECKKSCPVVRMGKLCMEVEKTSPMVYISESLCIGCGICVKKASRL